MMDKSTTDPKNHNHRQIHVEGCAAEILETLPLVDIYYDDYPCALFDGVNPSLNQYLDKICESVVDGGLLIFDMKYFRFSFNQKNLAYQVYENNDNRVQYLGEAEWMNLADVAVIKTTDVMVSKYIINPTDKVNFSEWVKGVIPIPKLAVRRLHQENLGSRHSFSRFRVLPSNLE